MRFRKKPVVIEARELNIAAFDDVKTWCGGRDWSRPPMRAITGITIQTLEGDMHAEFGDWIIRGVKGEFYPCKPDIFDLTYEPERIHAAAGIALGEQDAEIARLRAELERLRPDRRFPIQGGPSILWSAMVKHEPQMLRNHGQTFERMAERGGLDSMEALAVYEDREYPLNATNEELDAHRQRWREVVAKHDAEASEVVKLRAEVERLTRERDEAKACPMILCPYESRAEKAEARVAELEAIQKIAHVQVDDDGDLWLHLDGGSNYKASFNITAKLTHPTGVLSGGVRQATEALRALLSPKPAPLPDLLAEVLPPKCWHCSYNGKIVVKFCMRDGCPETPKFDIGGTVKFKSEERTEVALGASPSKPSEDGTEPVADTRRSLPEGSTPSLASSGLTPDRIHRMKLARDAFRAAMGKPAPCGTCGDSGSGGAPCGDCGAGKPCATCERIGHVGDDGGPCGCATCPDCRGEGK